MFCIFTTWRYKKFRLLLNIYKSALALIHWVFSYKFEASTFLPSLEKRKFEQRKFDKKSLPFEIKNIK